MENNLSTYFCLRDNFLTRSKEVSVDVEYLLNNEYKITFSKKSIKKEFILYDSSDDNYDVFKEKKNVLSDTINDIINTFYSNVFFKKGDILILFKQTSFDSNVFNFIFDGIKFINFEYDFGYYGYIPLFLVKYFNIKNKENFFKNYFVLEDDVDLFNRLQITFLREKLLNYKYDKDQQLFDDMLKNKFIPLLKGVGSIDISHEEEIDDSFKYYFEDIMDENMNIK